MKPVRADNDGRGRSTKTVVFGGSGFLGSHVADSLQEKGHQVRIVDLRPSEHLKPGQEMMIADLLDETLVAQAVEGCDYVYNFAGTADIDSANRRPIDTVRFNILGNAILLEACRKAKIRRFVYASTVYVYSQMGGFYRCSKQSAELYIEMYQQQYGLPYTILRYGSLYGPRADESNAVHRYLKEALLFGKIVCRGNGEEVREYVHVEDAARNSVEVLSAEFENQCLVLSGHQPMKVRDLLEMIQEILNTKVELVFESPDNNVHYWRTPYNFRPSLGKKLVSSYYLDMGQGLLACINEIYDKERIYMSESQPIALQAKS